MQLLKNLKLINLLNLIQIYNPNIIMIMYIYIIKFGIEQYIFIFNFYLNYAMPHNFAYYMAVITFNYRKWSLIHYIIQKLFTLVLFVYNFYFSIQIIGFSDNSCLLFIQFMNKQIILGAFIIIVSFFHIVIYIYCLMSYSKNQYINSLPQVCLKHLAFLIQMIPLISPFTLNCLYILATYKKDQSISIIAIILSISTVLIWLMRIICLRENYLNLNMRLQNKEQILQIIMFVGNIILGLCNLNNLIIIIWQISLLTLIIFLKFCYFSSLTEQLQYCTFIGKILYLGIVSIQLIRCYTPSFDLIQLFAISFAIFITLEKFKFFKLLFQYKYYCSFQEKSLQVEDLIILAHLIATKNKPRMFNFQFYKKVDQIFLQMTAAENNIDRVEKQNPVQYFLKQRSDLKKNIKKIDVKNINHYMIYWYIQNNQYLNAIRYFAQWSIQKQSLIKECEIKLCKLQLFEYIRQSQKSLKIVQQQTRLNICLLKRKSEEIQPKQIIQHENILIKIINEVNKLIQINNEFLKKINHQNSTNEFIKSDLIRQYKLKRQIQYFVAQNTQKFQCKQFLIVYYIYVFVCCQIKYSSFAYFMKFFSKIQVNLTALKKQLNLQKYMITLISGENQSIGHIINANMPMKSFFALTDDKIQQKVVNIDVFLPKQISNSHNSFMLNFKKKGTSKFIGLSRQLVFIKNGHCIPVQIYIKIFPFVDGLAFAARVKLLKNNNLLLLYNSEGVINQFTQNLFETIKITQKPTLFEIFKNFKKQNQKKNIKQEIFGLQSRIIKSDNMIIKATFSSLNGQNYYLGVCKMYVYETRSCRKKTQSRISFKTKSLMQQQSNENQIYYQSQFYQKKFNEIQSKISNTKSNDDLIIKYKLNIILLVIIFIGGISIIQNLEKKFTIKSKSHLNFYDTLSTNFVTRNYQTFNIFALLRAIQTGFISDNITSIYNISSFQRYLRNSANLFLNRTARTEFFIDQSIQEVSVDIVNLISVEQIILSVSTPNIKISILEAISLQKSFLMQIFDEKQSDFENFFSLDIYIYQYLFYQLSSSANQIFQNIFQKIINDIQQQKYTYIIVLVCILTIIVILKIIHVLTHIEIEKKMDNYLNLLLQISELELQKKYKLNLSTLQLLNKLKKYSVTDISIEPYKNSISCLVGKFEYVFQQNKIKFEKNYLNQQDFIFKKNKKSKFKIENMSNKISEILLMVVLILPLTYYSYNSISYTSSIHQQMKIYNQYKIQIQQLTNNLPYLLSIPIYSVINNNTNTFFSRNTTQLIENLTYSIFHRQFQSIFQNNLDWTQSKIFLYQSHCLSNDTLCPKLISNIFNQTVPAIINKFAMQIVVLMTLIQSNNSSSLSRINKQITQLQISYQQYLRPLLEIASRYGIKISTQNLQHNQNVKDQIFFYILQPMFIISFLFFMYDLYKKQQTFKIVKKQTLSCMSVDVLIKKIKFSNQFNRL